MSERIYRVHDDTLEELIDALRELPIDVRNAHAAERESRDTLVQYARLEGNTDDRTAELARLYAFLHERRAAMDRFVDAAEALREAVADSNELARMRLAHAVIASYLDLKALGDRP